MVSLWFIRMQSQSVCHRTKKAASAEDVLFYSQTERRNWDWGWRRRSSVWAHLCSSPFSGKERGPFICWKVGLVLHNYTQKKTQFFTIPLHQQDQTAFFPLDNPERYASLKQSPKGPRLPHCWEDPLQGWDDKAVDVLASPPTERESKQNCKVINQDCLWAEDM